MQQQSPRVAVVGAGISGLTAAWRLLAHPARPEVVVLEQSRAPGGKVQLGGLAGVPVDLGAESVLARRPEALDLLAELGLAAEVEHPRTSAAGVYSRGRLRPIPTGTVLGIPADPAALGDLLDPEELTWLAGEPDRPAAPVHQDVDVASWLISRVGPAPVQRLVEPVLGGVYAGRADRLSLAATAPELWQVARSGGSLLAALARRPAPAGPVFAGLRGGLGRLPGVLAQRLRDAGVQLRLGVTVRELTRSGTGWRLITGSAGSPEALDVDAVVLAVPVTPAARLLRDVCPPAAAVLAEVPAASVALVTALVPGYLLGHVAGSGFLVPPVEGRQVKAVTLSSAKWAWQDEAARAAAPGGLAVVRLSLGRAGEAAVLQRDDDELAELALAELGAMTGRPDLEEEVRADQVGVTRWGGALPQYTVGHPGRIHRVEEAVAGLPGLALAGAYLDGVGIPACIAAAGRAAWQAMVRGDAG